MLDPPRKNQPPPGPETNSLRVLPQLPRAYLAPAPAPIPRSGASPATGLEHKRIKKRHFHPKPARARPRSSSGDPEGARAFRYRRPSLPPCLAIGRSRALLAALIGQRPQTPPLPEQRAAAVRREATGEAGPPGVRAAPGRVPARTARAARALPGPPRAPVTPQSPSLLPSAHSYDRAGPPRLPPLSLSHHPHPARPFGDKGPPSPACAPPRDSTLLLGYSYHLEKAGFFFKSLCA